MHTVVFLLELMFVHVCVRAHVCVPVLVQGWGMRTSVHLCLFVCVCVWFFVCLCVHVCVCVRVRACIHASVNVTNACTSMPF